jgi:hypothetical protein
MRNVGGISWGYNARINQYRGIRYDAAVYFDNPKSKPTVLKLYDKSKIDQRQIDKELQMMNYNTCRLCPEVRAEIDWTA